MSLTAVADIGTYSTKVVAGKLQDEVITLAGVGKCNTEGVKNGRIIKPDRAGRSLLEATERAEEMASKKIQSIHFGVGGEPLRFSTNEATVTVSSKDRKIRRKDLKRLKDLVNSIELEVNEKIISTIPHGFSLDGQKGVTDPIGLEGRRLDITATLVIANNKLVNNFNKVASRAGYKLGDLLPKPQCTGRLLLTEEERRRGKILIDFGEETTELLFYKEGQMVDQITLPLGGKTLTGDISAKLNVSRVKAGKIKQESQLSEPDGSWKSSGQTKDGPKRKEEGESSEVFSTISARTREIFDLALSKTRDQGHGTLLDYGIKITGGSSRLTGLFEFLNDTFEHHFERGIPTRPVAGIKDVVDNPSYGPVLGTLNCILEERITSKDQESQDSKKLQLLQRIRKKLNSTFYD